MAKQWNYASSNQRVGDMICTACRQPITAGDNDFRFRETDDAYLPQHRACSQDDQQWAIIDKRREEYRAYWSRQKAALQAYINEFGAPDDDLIDECMAERRTSEQSLQEHDHGR